VFAQQSLKPKLSRRRYASVSYALHTVFRDQKQQNILVVSRCSGTARSPRAAEGLCGWQHVRRAVYGL